MSVSAIAPKLAIKLGFSLIWNGIINVVTRNGDLYVGLDSEDK